ncbi:MAG: bifunctional (p)ppGpp synthetase/guanosine-3',5'-bis(diphosphate) 3'-pyrophosphohydrolase [Pseudomonadota bacterium]
MTKEQSNAQNAVEPVSKIAPSLGARSTQGHANARPKPAKDARPVEDPVASTSEVASLEIAQNSEISKGTSALERFADKCNRLSAKEARQIKDLEPRSDSIGTRKALADKDAEQVDISSERIVSDQNQKAEKPIRAVTQTTTTRLSSKESNASQPKQPVGFIRQVELIDRVREYDPEVDEDLLNKAYVFSMRAHGGQTRKSGDPYFTHPLAVAGILTELKADPATVATALLHDVVEDTDTTVQDIEKVFGSEIATLVDGVTKLSKIELRSEASKQAENFRKLVVAMADDVRVLLVKLADRLHNMRTLHFFDDPEKRRRIALETMEIYAPLAGRIGVQRFREELEEISFRVLNPEAAEMISTRLDALQRTVVHSIVGLAQTLRQKLEDAEINAEVHSREKRPFSIWRKMSTKNVSFDELADIYAFRIIVETVEDCYRALGVIHTTWRMIPSEFDDYISASKPNNYRSIHTAVIGPPLSDEQETSTQSKNKGKAKPQSVSADPEGGRQRIEIQIRTREMHESAERGVAAHWRYKDTTTAQSESVDGRRSVEIVSPDNFDPYETPRRLVEMFQHGDDLNEALQYAKLELFQDQVFCLSPKGRVIALPRGATGLDFAYAVHTDIGDTCIGVKVNGISRPLRTPLNNGDVVLVLRSDNAPPPPDWETMALTGRARSAIRRRIKRMKHEEHITLGRAVAENVFTGVQLELSSKAVRGALKRLGEESVDAVFARVGRGDLDATDLVEAVYPGAALETDGQMNAPQLFAPAQPRRAIVGLPVKSVATMGTCCTPVPGERIVGIKGPDNAVTVHTIYCDYLAKIDPPQSDWIDLSWRSGPDILAECSVRVSIRNEVGALSEVASIMARYNVSIENIRFTTRDHDFIEMDVDVIIKDSKQLEQMLAGVRASAYVVGADRAEGYAHDA